jgi:hypothetical protein
MGTPRQFSLQLKEFGDAVTEEHLSRIVRFLGFNLFNRIVKNTPVDTGRAQASWNIQAGNPDLSVQPEGAPFYAPNLVPVWAWKPFQKVWITNNLDYIVPLEEGHSEKVTPSAGRMVRLSVLETAELAKLKGFA